MNAILEGINSAGRVFVEFAGPMLVQSSVLIVILLIGDFLLRRKVRAVLRYWLWMLVFVKLVLPISLTTPVSLGQWFGGRLEYVQREYTPAVVSEVAEMRPVEMGQEFGPVEDGTTEVRWERLTPLPVMEVEPVAAESGAEGAVAITPVTWEGWVFLGWLAGVVAMGLLLVQRAIFVVGLVAQARGVNGLMSDTLKYCCRRMGVKGEIGLKVSANATSPAVCGLFRPVILVPQDLGPNLGAGGLRVVLMHELAHIRRGDLWVNLVQTVLQIVYFYNPLLWVANAVIRRVREQAVDEAVQVAMGEKAGEYPETLVSVAKLAFERPALSLRLIGVVESKSTLEGRVRRMLERPIPKSAKLGFLGLIVILVAGAILLPMAKGENLTYHARKAMKQADLEARQLNHEYIGTEHILLALVGDGRGVAATILKNIDVDIEKVRPEVGKYVKSGSNKVKKRKLPQTPRAKKVLIYAEEEARSLNHDCISGEHILLALLRVEDGVGGQVLMNLGAKYGDVRQEVLELVGPGPIRGGHPTLVISGTVKDSATGLPIAGAKVGDEHYLEGVRSTLTHSDGGYNYLTWPEHHGIKAESGGYKTQRESLYSGHFDFGKEEVEEVINFNLEPESVSQAPGFKKTLPNGVTVELVGICKYPSMEGGFWRADGTILKDSNLEKVPPLPMPISDMTDRLRIFLRYYEGIDTEIVTWKFDEIPIPFPGHYVRGPENDSANWYSLISSFPIPSGQNTSTLSFAISQGRYKGKWRGHSAETSFGSYVIGRPFKFKTDNEVVRNKTAITLSHNLSDVQHRLMVKDKNDKWHKGKLAENSGPGGLIQQTYVFEKIEPKEVDYPVLQTRPYQWVTFKNVSLKPNFKTAVQVEVEKPAVEVEGAGVRFRIVDEVSGEPLKNRELNICSFVYFKLGPGAPSPYLDKNAEWYITSVTTDDNGFFALELASIDVTDIIVEPGKSHNIVKFERSSNLAHTKSTDHVRVVNFEPGTTRVVSNMIYDIKRKIVKTIPISGRAEEKPYEVILLKAKRIVASETDRKSAVGFEGGDEILSKFFSYLDSTIEQLAAEYPQLVDWDVKKTEPQWWRPGKMLTAKELVYNHALSPSKSSNYRDWYGRNGCHIRISVFTEAEWNRLEGPGIKTEIFGLRMGQFFVVATVITEKPEFPELEQKINDIIRSAVINTNRNPAVGVQGEKVPPPGRCALSFDGVDDYLEIEASESLQLGRYFTVQMWVKPEFPETSTPDKERNLLSKGGYVLGPPDEKGNRQAKPYGFGFKLIPEGESQINFEVCSASHQGIHGSIAGFSKPSDWLHLSVVFDGNKGRINRGVLFELSEETYEPAPKSN
ncbi:MAG: M56 family metallopeptidase, partial [Planctomycetota bacterium]